MHSYKFRLYPSKSQQEKFWLHANKLNELYNYFLNQKIEAYKKDKTHINRIKQQSELPKLKQQDLSLKEINSGVLQNVTFRLDRAYKAFFRRIQNKGEAPGYPKFRSCKEFFGITFPKHGKYYIKNNIFVTRIYGKMKFSKHRTINGNIRQIFVSCKNNQWFISITTDYIQNKNKIKNKIVGIDLGITNLIATSDGELIKNPSHAKYFDKQISKLKSKKDKILKKRSKKHKFYSKIIKRLYDVKVKKIKDFQHKISKRLSTKYDTIVLENLNLKKMSESNITPLNRELRNSSLGQFVEFLKYKCNKIILVNPKNTSKTCNNCGYIHKNLKLSDREITCKCGISYNRDINAAKNILCLGRAILEKGYTIKNTINDFIIDRKLDNNSSLGSTRLNYE